jgi:NAD(P)-dependent dehydrogenase (short-subunit alcohol dehydrogenase family)
MTVTLITGANKCIGYETARCLLELGHTVYVGARDAECGKAAVGELGASFPHLDVPDDVCVAAALDRLGRVENRLDVLVNNAGIYRAGAATAGLTANDSPGSRRAARIPRSTGMDPFR